MSIEHNEQFETNKPQIWIIDDDENSSRSILRLGIIMNDKIQLNSFNNGEEALAKLEELIKNKQELPWQILIDYQLDQEVENPVIKTGVVFIEELKKLADQYNIHLPEIVAFSTSDESNEELMNAGASSTVNKQQGSQYIKNLKK